MDMGSKECDPSVAALPVSDPRCVKAMECCTAFYAAENASQAETPWAGQFVYGHWTAYYWIAAVGVLAVWHACNTIMDRRASSRPASSTQQSGAGALDKARALGRFAFYRSKGQRYSCIALPRAGLVVFLLITVVFLAAIIFAERPYYRPHFGYGSPPIAIRCGLIAFACHPILIALAGKANIVTLLTGISHERLNIVHQWVGWIVFVVSLIHTIPFFLASVRDRGNGGFQRVKSEFYYNSPGVSEYSGTPPLAMLFGLCVFSIRQVRERFYESFYVGHILLSITYLGLLFWHSGNERDSWAYLWVTLAVWLASWLVRLFWCMRSTNVRSPWFVGAQATVQLLPANLVRIEVDRPESFNFTPAQHCFLRFNRLAPYDHHPFTIASAPTRGGGGSDDDEKAKESTTLVFLVKVRDGFTRRLAAQCKVSEDEAFDTSVSVDGPYGGFPYPRRLEQRYDSILLVAGGSGVSACLPWLLHMAALTRRRVRLDSITLVWVFRDPQSFEWAAKELQQAVGAAGSVQVKVRLHVTGGDGGFLSEHSAQAGKDKEKGKEIRVDAVPDPLYERMKAVGDVFPGRPEPREDVKRETTAVPGKRLFVFSCGPSGLNDAVANACAAEQKAVWRGDVAEVKLHVETFSW
ncbi:ferric reductase NAD binding domain-containing protein [Phyllosticta citribraziliensis]|uniref:ferric-chelate reductase (NADPH) n=1 Tax=Phyllosticta citribraziliensis TaxID=989973 RepID=A0ABR1L8D9_9PEZI